MSNDLPNVVNILLFVLILLANLVFAYSWIKMMFAGAS